MAGLRFQLDCYVDENPTGTLVAGVKIPDALAQKIPAIRDAIRVLKSYATKINEGQSNEEATVKAQYQICRHNEGDNHLPCGEWQEI